MEKGWTEETLEDNKKKCWGKTEKQNYLKPKWEDTLHCERSSHRIEDRSRQLSHLYRLVNLKVKQKKRAEQKKRGFVKERAETSSDKNTDCFPWNKATQALESGQFLFKLRWLQQKVFSASVVRISTSWVFLFWQLFTELQHTHWQLTTSMFDKN